VRALTNWSGAVAGLLLIICGGLVQAALPGYGASGFALIPLPITLQVPALLLTALVCGARSAMLAGVAYISLGLFQLPVFQAGGGLNYLLDPGFGYIAGFLPAAWLSGRIDQTAGDGQRPQPHRRCRSRIAGAATVWADQSSVGRPGGTLERSLAFSC